MPRTKHQISQYRKPKRALDPVVHALRKRRYEINLSAEAVYERLNVALATVQCWECGRNTPPLVWLHRWAKTLGCTIACLPESTSPDKGSTDSSR